MVGRISITPLRRNPLGERDHNRIEVDEKKTSKKKLNGAAGKLNTAAAIAIRCDEVGEGGGRGKTRSLSRIRNREISSRYKAAMAMPTAASVAPKAIQGRVVGRGGLMKPRFGNSCRQSLVASMEIISLDSLSPPPPSSLSSFPSNNGGNFGHPASTSDSINETHSIDDEERLSSNVPLHKSSVVVKVVLSSRSRIDHRSSSSPSQIIDSPTSSTNSSTTPPPPPPPPSTTNRSFQIVVPPSISHLKGATAMKRITPSASSHSSSLSSSLESRKGGQIRGLNQPEDSHHLRILHNRWLQWRFVNTSVQKAINTQQALAQRNLYNAWHKISDLEASVAERRVQLQKARYNLMVETLLLSQEPLLKDWKSFEQEHISSLSGLIEALHALTIRIPIIGGAKIDMDTLKEALTSAMEVMQAVDSTVNKLIQKAEHIDVVLSEVAGTVVKERAYLEGCGDLLALADSFKLLECSLRAHLIEAYQVKRRHCQARSILRDIFA